MKPMAPVVWHSVGAQLLRARDYFYTSPTKPAQGMPWRGGVPVLFPQFAELGSLPKHGFARSSIWQRTGDSAWALDFCSTKRPFWPHAARLELGYTPNVQGIEAGGALCLDIKNTGNTSFEFTGGLHPYWAVKDAGAACIFGLGGLLVNDVYQPSRIALPNEWRPSDGQAVEVLVQGCPDVVLQDGARRILLQASGFTEWMVWNPGRELAAGLGDMPANDWARFLCIEPVCVKNPVMLNAGQSFRFSLSWRLL